MNILLPATGMDHLLITESGYSTTAMAPIATVPPDRFITAASHGIIA